MAATKSGASLVASQSCAAATAVNGITGVRDLTTAYGATIVARVTNGGTGPTIGCTIEVDVSIDNSTWRQFAQVVAGVTASAVLEQPFVIPDNVLYVRLGFGGNTGQAVTVAGDIHVLTGI